MENCTPELSCPDCDEKVFTLRDLLKHKKVCKDRVCVICMDKQASSILEPCHHNKCCAECIYTILKTSDKCPICRTVVQKVHGEVTYTAADVLDKAARIVIFNYTIMSQVDAIALVQWYQQINDDPIQTPILQRVLELLQNSWTEVLEKAIQIVHQILNI
jgi:Zinc finger, C3HC4 type (RING finger)